MPPLTSADLRTWHVLFTDDRPACDITAVYPARDDSLSGLISFKDHRHKIVAVAPEFAVSLVQQCPDSDPCAVADSCAVCAARRQRGSWAHAAAPAGDLERALAALMRLRVDAGDTADLYVYLREGETDPRPAGQLTITRGGEERFGPRLHLVLSGYTPGPKVSDGELEAAVAAESAR